MKTYLVTGVVQGIGKGIRERLLSEGFRVVGLDKQDDPLSAELVEKYPEYYRTVKIDLGDRPTLLQFVKDFNEKLDGIVNNAGEIYFNNWEELSFGDWDRTLEVNLTSPLVLTHGLYKNLKENSSIVNIASVDGTLAAFDSVAYATSKAGLMNLTQSLAAILGDRKKIRVNAIAPGWIETEMTASTLPKESIDLAPLSRNGKPQDIANLVNFLLSEESSFITGQTITADGGLFCVDYTLWKEAQDLEE